MKTAVVTFLRVSVLVTLILPLSVNGLIPKHNKGFCRICPTHLGLSSAPSELPLLPKGRAAVKRKPKQPSNSNKTLRNVVQIEADSSTADAVDGRSLHALPMVIPKLSDILKANQNRDFSSNTRKKNASTENPPISQRRPSAPKSPQHSTETKLPWRADFQDSIRTQGRIKKAFTTVSSPASGQKDSSSSNAERAIAVLKELLSTSPTECNAANVICALTYSAKSMGDHNFSNKRQQQPPNNELQDLLFRVFDILHELVQEKQLTARQLSNAAWAIGKHFDRDESLLPCGPEFTALSSSDTEVGVAEQWSLNDSPNQREMQRQTVDQTVDMIGQQLTALLEETDDRCQETPYQLKVGEICMASWAYGILRRRHRPPGWQEPPQLGRLPGVRNNKRPRNQRPTKEDDVIVFEQWGSFSRKVKNDDRSVSASSEITDRLFDAIAGALSRSPRESSKPETADDATGERQRGYRTNLEMCSWRELANLGWAFASHGSCRSVPAQALLIELSQEAGHRLKVGGGATKNLQTRDIAQLVWAMGTLQADNFRLADDLVELVEALSGFLRLAGKSAAFGRGRVLRRWSCPDLVQVAISLAHARIDELPLLRAVYEESNYRLMEKMEQRSTNQGGERMALLAWEVSVLLWAQARLNLQASQGAEFDDFAWEAPKFIMKALDEAGSSLKDIGIGPQEQANIAWSLTVLEQHQSHDAIRLLKRIFEEAAQSCEDDQVIQLEHAHQLWQAYFLLEAESPEAVEGVPTWFCDYLRAKWLVEKARPKISSARHKSLSQALHFMGVDHYNEHDEDIDVAIVLKESAEWTHETETVDASKDRVSVAVEFDGPNHFTRERVMVGERPKHPRALGHTVLKYRLLKKQGWTVVRVPYYEFDKIPFWASMVRTAEYARLPFVIVICANFF
jgi:RAP domain